MISVVMPAYNSAATIGEQLAALAAEQVDEPWEVIVADNGSTDTTRSVVEAWNDRLPVRVVDAGQRRGAAHARNVGVTAARGDRILLCDADDVVGPGWVGHLGSALRDHRFVCGLIDRGELNPGFASLWRYRAPVMGPRPQHGYLVMATTGNVGFRRELFDELGGFDESLLRGQDTDFSWRAVQGGAALHVVPEAILYYRLPETPRVWLRKGLSDGESAVILYLRHRDRGMRREPVRAALRSYTSLLQQLPGIVRERDRPATCIWAHAAGTCMGRVIGSVRQRTLFL